MHLMKSILQGVRGGSHFLTSREACCSSSSSSSSSSRSSSSSSSSSRSSSSSSSCCCCCCGDDGSLWFFLGSGEKAKLPSMYLVPHHLQFFQEDLETSSFCSCSFFFHPSRISLYTRVFPKIGIPQNAWFIRENPIRVDDLG